MKYELAKQLKDAEYPQPVEGNYQCQRIHAYHYAVPEHEDDIHIPSIEELFQELSDYFFFLCKIGGNYSITGYPLGVPHNHENQFYSGNNASPVEALANLYLEVKKRQ